VNSNVALHCKKLCYILDARVSIRWLAGWL